MPTIFPLSASVGQEYDGYIFDGTAWNLKGNEYNPTYYSDTPPDNPRPGDLWVDSSVDIAESPLDDYLTIASASTTYATKSELENIDLSSASAAAVAYLVDSAPSALDTLNELAAALNDDSNYASTVAGQISNLNSGLSQVITNKLDSQEAYSTFLTSASMQTVPVYVMNSGSSAQRPVSASVGMFRYNTDSGYPEWYDINTSVWWNFNQLKTIPVEYLVIGGGGAGGVDQGGGGGAGAYIAGSTNLNSGTYSVKVGAGGSGATGMIGNKGSQSSFYNYNADGGGGGGTYDKVAGTSNGNASGGGGGGGTPGTGGSGAAGGAFGYAGGNGGGLGTYQGGGGGGAGEAGNTDGIGQGGDGVYSSITGSSIARAGGGSGGGSNGNIAGGDGGGGAGGTEPGQKNGTSGTVNTGSGGGGGGANSTSTPGNGGSGVVILKFPDYINVQFSSGVTSNMISYSGYDVYVITATSTTSETVTIS